jgi:hypothetical protein
MAYNKQEIYEQAETAIKENNLFFIDDIVAWLPISKETLYKYFPVDSDKMDNLKRLLNENKVKTKSAIRAKLFKGQKAAELLALYRLICTQEERRYLNQQYIEHEVPGGLEIKTSEKSKEIIDKLKNDND